MNLGRVYEHLGQFKEAIEHFQKALDLDKNYMRAKQSMSLAYNNEAMASEDKELALKLLQQALQYEPDDPVVRDEGAECGLRSFVFGLSALRPSRCDVFSYQAPYGVGYLVATISVRDASPGAER